MQDNCSLHQNDAVNLALACRFITPVPISPSMPVYNVAADSSVGAATDDAVVSAVRLAAWSTSTYRAAPSA